MAGPYPYARFVMPFAYAPSQTGAPLAGAQLFFFESGTSTPLDTWADDTLSTPNLNPITADIAGRFTAIFLDPAQVYKVLLVSSDGVTIWAADPVSAFNATTITQQAFAVSQVTVDGNGQVPVTGVCGDDIVPIACQIYAAILQADQPGDLVVDVWAAPFVVNTPPNASNSITAADPPTLSSSVSSYDSVLTGWATSLAENTALRYNIVSIDTITRFTLTLFARATT